MSEDGSESTEKEIQLAEAKTSDNPPVESNLDKLLHDDVQSETAGLLNGDKHLPPGKLTPYLLLCSGIAVLGGLNYGYHTGVLNNPKQVITNCSELYDPATNALDLPPCWAIPEALWGTIVGMFAIGGLVGGLVAGKLSDWMGRTTLILCNNFFFALGSLLMGFAISEAMLIAARIIVGIGCGIATVVIPTYLGEISPANYRGAIGVLTQLSITLGISVSQLLGLALSDVPEWRWLVGIPFFFSLAQVILMPAVVQSPRWLVMKDRGEQAKIVLMKLRSYSHKTSEIEYDQIVEGQRKTTVITIKELLTNPAFRKPLTIALMLQVIQQLSGINAVFYYSTDIFKRSNPEIAEILTVMVGILNVILTVVSIFLMDKAGRRVLLIIGEVGMIVTAALYTISFVFDITWLSTTCTFVYVSAFAVGLGPIPFLILSEIFPTAAVSTASSMAIPINWLCNYLVGQFFPLMSEGLGDFVFLPFAGVLILALLFTLKVIPETKGKTLEQIAEILK